MFKENLTTNTIYTHMVLILNILQYLATIKKKKGVDYMQIKFIAPLKGKFFFCKKKV